MSRLQESGVAGVLVGRGALRNPWIFSQAADLAAGRTPRIVTDADRARFLLAYIDMLQQERLHEEKGFRHVAPGQQDAGIGGPARGHDKVGDQQAARAELVVHQRPGQRIAPARRDRNAASSIAELRDVIATFFAAGAAAATTGSPDRSTHSSIS